MKKILLAIMMLLCMSGVVYAENILTVESDLLPTEYRQTGISLMSSDNALEERLINAWKNLDSSVYVGDLNIPVSSSSSVYKGCVFANPIYYYVDNGFSCRYSGSKVTYFYPSYNETNKAKINNTISEINKATDIILMNIDDDMTEFEKVMTVHDYMVMNYQYDTSYSNHTITIMTEKTGVCMSYTFAFTHVMKQLGIDTMYISSSSMSHAWNLVKIDDEWYHIDLTWDDPLYDRYAQAMHTYALLNTEEIMGLEDPHYGFSLGSIVSDSTRFSDATWRKSMTSMAYVDGNSYWISGYDLVREDGEVIFSRLDGGDSFWNIEENYGYRGYCFAGLGCYEGVLYFNSDTALYSYNPKTNTTKKLLSFMGLSGLFIDNSTLKYATIINSLPAYAGEIQLNTIHATTTSDKDSHTISVRVYKDDATPTVVYCFGDSGCQKKEINTAGYSSVTFNCADEQTLFIWDDNMKPLKPKQTVRFSH